jgi:inner membrane protein
MPTVMTHAVVAGGLGTLFTSRRMPPLFWLTTVGLAMLPDIDVIFRVPYQDLLGHRGFTHSLLFALLAGGAAALLAGRRLGGSPFDLWGFFFLVTASHGLLDAFTNGGLGVGFFVPFDDRRYFFPWRPLEVSPIGLGFFSERGVKVLLNEMLWVWLPTVAVVVPVLLYRYWRVKKKAVQSSDRAP